MAFSAFERYCIASPISDSGRCINADFFINAHANRADVTQ